MRLMQQLLASAIPLLVNAAVLLYVCQRFVAAARQRVRIMGKMREFATIVRRARDSLDYIGDRVTKGMDEIGSDVGKELRDTDRLTTQSARLTALLGRFASLEETVIELVRTDRNRESVRVETPWNVTEEIERIVAAKRDAERHGNASPSGGRPEESTEERKAFSRNPLSKFSACGPREAAVVGNAATRRPADGRPRSATTPEVRLLGEPSRAHGPGPTESKRWK